MDHIQTNIQGLIYAHAHALTVATMLFCQICPSEVQPKYSTALFSDVGLQEDWLSHLRMYLSCLLKMAMVLPTHNCHSCVGKVERLEQKLKDLGSMLAQC